MVLKDNFDSLDNWTAEWPVVEIENGQLSLSTKPPTSSDETYSALAVSKIKANNFTFEVTLKTLEQLRQGSSPNSWEVGWVFFKWTDPKYFYWLLLKTDGYELGKKQGSYDQIFLVNKSDRQFPINRSYRIKIIARDKNIFAYVDGKLLLSYTDRDYIKSGAFCLYEEDSHVHFDNVLIKT